MKKIALLVGIFIVLVLGGILVMVGSVGIYDRARRKDRTAGDAVLAAKETEIAALKDENEAIKRGVRDTRAYATFLSLALCPTLENENKDALCMQDGAEWLNQTIQTGMAVSDDMIKESLGSFLQSLDAQKQTSSKQFYDLLKPLEARALSMIIEVLK